MRDNPEGCELDPAEKAVTVFISGAMSLVVGPSAGQLLLSDAVVGIGSGETHLFNFYFC